MKKNNSIKIIYDKLKPLRKKIYLETGLNRGIKVLSIMGLILFIVSLVSHFVPILYTEKCMIYIGILFGILALIIALFSYPSMKKTIKIADKLGCKERIITAWEYSSEESSEYKLQRKETIDFLKEINFKKLFKVNIRYKYIFISVFFTVLSISILFLPSNVKDKTQELEALKEQLEEHAKNIEKEKEKAYEDLEIPEEYKKELDEKLKELLEKFEKSKTEEEALKNIAIAKNELKKLEQNELSNDLKQIANSLQNTSLEDVSNAIKNNDVNDLKQALEKLIEQQQELTGDELKEISKELTNEELKEILEELGEAIENNDKNVINELAKNLESNLSSAMENSSNMKSVTQNLQSALNQAGNQIASNNTISQLAFGNASQQGDNSVPLNSGSTSGGTEGGDGSPSGSGQSGSQSGQGGQGGSAGKGEGSQGGQGSGQGGGQGGLGGNGAGEGSTNEDAGYSNDNGSVGHKSSNTKYQEGEYEALYDPNHLGGSSDPTFVQGEKTNGGTSTFENVEGVPIEKGGLVQYTEIVTEYKAEAIQSVDNLDVPVVMKDVILEYFSTID